MPGRHKLDVDGHIYGCFRVIRRDGDNTRHVHVECIHCGTSRMVELSNIRNREPPACPSCVEAARQSSSFIYARPRRSVGRSIRIGQRCISLDIGVRFQALIEREAIGKPMTPREQLWCDLVIRRGRKTVQRHWRRYGRTRRLSLVKVAGGTDEPYEVPEVPDPGLHWGLTGIYHWREED